MSGVEVAGLLLGAFPLVISALEHYRKGFKPLQEWWMFESEFGNFIEELGTQQARFDMNLEKLLEPFVTSDKNMNELLNDQTGKLWQEPILQSQLRKRLGASLQWYLAICNKMFKVLDRLKTLLGITNGKVRNSSLIRRSNFAYNAWF
jgi:hypothetical protein